MSLGKKTLHPDVEQKLLGIIIEIRKELNFQSHTKSIVKTANQKLRTLTIVVAFMNNFNKKAISNSFIKEQFNYCPLL